MCRNTNPGWLACGLYIWSNVLVSGLAPGFPPSQQNNDMISCEKNLAHFSIHPFCRAYVWSIFHYITSFIVKISQCYAMLAGPLSLIMWCAHGFFFIKCKRSVVFLSACIRRWNWRGSLWRLHFILNEDFLLASEHLALQEYFAIQDFPILCPFVSLGLCMQQ